jgi:hypothetical protein
VMRADPDPRMQHRADALLVLDNLSSQRSVAIRTWWVAQRGRILPF